MAGINPAVSIFLNMGLAYPGDEQSSQPPLAGPTDEVSTVSVDDTFVPASGDPAALVCEATTEEEAVDALLERDPLARQAVTLALDLTTAGFDLAREFNDISRGEDQEVAIDRLLGRIEQVLGTFYETDAGIARRAILLSRISSEMENAGDILAQLAALSSDTPIMVVTRTLEQAQAAAERGDSERVSALLGANDFRTNFKQLSYGGKRFVFAARGNIAHTLAEQTQDSSERQRFLEQAVGLRIDALRMTHVQSLTSDQRRFLVEGYREQAADYRALQQFYDRIDMQDDAGQCELRAIDAEKMIKVYAENDLEGGGDNSGGAAPASNGGGTPPAPAVPSGTRALPVELDLAGIAEQLGRGGTVAFDAAAAAQLGEATAAFQLVQPGGTMGTFTDVGQPYEIGRLPSLTGFAEPALRLEAERPAGLLAP